MAGCGLDDSAVVLDGGVDEDGIGVLGGEHVLEVGIEEGLREVVMRCVLLGESSVGFDYSYELGVRIFGECGQKAFYVSVDEADNGYSDGFVRCCGAKWWRRESEEKSEGGEFHWVLSTLVAW